MRKTISLVLLTLLLCFTSTVWAADFDFDNLFGDDLLMEMDETESTIKPEEALLVNEGWEMGGNYSLSVNASRTLPKGKEPENDFSTGLSSELYLDARPNADFRVFGKVGLNYEIKEGQTNPPKLKLLELFSDFNYDNKVFFRAGKQNVGWGVGHFFSPADVNFGRMNALVQSKREGSTALRAHYPHQSNNYYLYVLLDGVSEPDEIAIAPKMEYVLGRSEIGLGGFYQKNKAPRAIATVSSSLGDFAVFGEAVVSKSTDKMTAPVEKDDQLFFHGTMGTRYTHNDPDNLLNLTGVVQYYYDGEGYANQKQIHHLAGVLSWNQILDSKFSASASLMANLSDKSGIVRTNLSLPSFSKISPSVGVSFNYGEIGSQYGFLGRNTIISAAVTIGSGSF